MRRTGKTLVCALLLAAIANGAVRWGKPIQEAGLKVE